METFLSLPSGTIVNLSEIASLSFERKPIDAMPLNHPPGYLHLKNVEKPLLLSAMDASSIQDYLAGLVYGYERTTQQTTIYKIDESVWWQEWKKAIDAYTASRKEKPNQVIIDTKKGN